MSMAIAISIVQAAAITSPGTQDFTSSGFGTPKAAMFFVTEATANNTPTANGQLSMGFTDGVRHGCMTAGAKDAVSPALHNGPHRWASALNVIAICGDPETIVSKAAFSSWITDGVRINWPMGFAASSAYLVTVVLFGGSDLSAYVGNFSRVSQDTELNITAPGFQPDVIALAGNYQNAMDGIVNAGEHSSISCLGFATSSAQCCTMMRDQENTNPSQCLDYVSNAYASYNSAADQQIEINTFDSSGFSAWARGSGWDDISAYQFIYLALKCVGKQVFVGAVNSPTGTGTQATTDPGFTPDFAMQIISPVPAINFNETTNANGAGSFAIALMGGTSTLVSCGMISRDNASASDTESLCSDSFRLRRADQLDVRTANTLAFTSTGWTLNYGQADATVRKWPTLAIGSTGQTDTQYLQSLIDAGVAGSTVVIPAKPGGGNWLVSTASGSGTGDPRYALTLKSGTTGNPITYQIDGMIGCTPGSFLGVRDCMLGCDKLHDITITGSGYLDGASMPQTGDHRHCLQIRGSDSVTIDASDGFTMKNAGGDNLYIGPTELGDQDAFRTPCTNINANDLVLTGARRNNLTVLSVNGMYFQRCRWATALGVAPQSGIDLEPEENTTGYLPADRHKDQLIDVLFEDCQGDGNAATDWKINVSLMTSSHQPIDVTFRRCTSIRNAVAAPWGFHAKFLPGTFVTSPTGSIVFEDCSATGLDDAGLRLDWRLDCNVVLRFDDFVTDSCGRHSGNFSRSFNFAGSPTGAAILFNNNRAVRTTTAKVSTVTSPGGAATNASGHVFVVDYGTPTISNAEILTPNILYDGIQTMPTFTRCEFSAMVDTISTNANSISTPIEQVGFKKLADMRALTNLRLYHSTSILSITSTPTSFNLANGSLLDGFGNSIAFAKIYGILIANESVTHGDAIGITGNFITTQYLALGTGPVTVTAGETFSIGSQYSYRQVIASSADTITLTRLTGASSIPAEIIIVGTTL